jgi:hypothetical protein
VTIDFKKVVSKFEMALGREWSVKSRYNIWPLKCSKGPSLKYCYTMHHKSCYIKYYTWSEPMSTQDSPTNIS